MHANDKLIDCAAPAELLPSQAVSPRLEAQAQLDLTRTLLSAALFAFRTQVSKGACEERVSQARQTLVFWRERLESQLAARTAR